MDRFTLARLMGHSSPSVAARYYIHVTETHVAAGFGKFVEYQTRNVAEGLPPRSRKPAKRSNERFLRFVVHTAVHSMVTNGCKRLNPLARLLDSQS